MCILQGPKYRCCLRYPSLRAWQCGEEESSTASLSSAFKDPALLSYSTEMGFQDSSFDCEPCEPASLLSILGPYLGWKWGSFKRLTHVYIHTYLHTHALASTHIITSNPCQFRAYPKSHVACGHGSYGD